MIYTRLYFCVSYTYWLKHRILIYWILYHLYMYRMVKYITHISCVYFYGERSLASLLLYRWLSWVGPLGLRILHFLSTILPHSLNARRSSRMQSKKNEARSRNNIEMEDKNKINEISFLHIFFLWLFMVLVCY